MLVLYTEFLYIWASLLFHYYDCSSYHRFSQYIVYVPTLL